MLKSTSNIKVILSGGWALKITKPQKRFSVRVKEFLHSIYAHCISTGKRPNVDMVAADLKTLRNVDGTKKYNKDEWLTPSHIRTETTYLTRFSIYMCVFLFSIIKHNCKKDDDLCFLLK
jgi:hypothetical protein